MLKIFPPVLFCVMFLNSIFLGKNNISKTPLPPFQTTTDSLAAPRNKPSSLERPGSALFKSSISHGNSNAAKMNGMWLWFGLYVLSGLLCGGLSGYIAISKGLPARSCFFIGFFLSLPGCVYVMTRRSRVKQNVPAGLIKVPETHAPLPCEKCRYTNHPAAKRCAGCGTILHPALESDIDRLG